MLNKLRNFNWTKNMFLVPILLVAGISISHVVSWYDMSNPHNWAIYLSIAIEIGAMTSLIAATKKIKGGVWFMFGLVTFIQMIGNIFYSYVQIDETGELFKNWIELTAPIFESMGTDATDIIPHKRWLAILEGGLLPLISLTALHFYIKYDNTDDRKNPGPIEEGPTGPSDDLIGQEPNIQEPTIPVQPNNESITPTTEKPKIYGPDSEYNQIMAEQWEEYRVKEDKPTEPLFSPEYYATKEKVAKLEEKTDKELGKYDMKFGPEYTKMIDEMEEDVLPPPYLSEDFIKDTDLFNEQKEKVEEMIDEMKPEEKSDPTEIIQQPAQPFEVFSQPFTDVETERQKHLKFRKRITEDEDGKKTLIYPKRDKITQKIIK